jgi:arabinofuranosyltransferase
MAITMLTFSRSFVEYSVSGFQTPLAVTLLAAFWMVFWRMAAGKRQITALTALSALCALTDLLVAVVMLPGLIVASKRADIRTRTQAVAIGLVPVAAWLLFAVIYYGFVLPNPVTAAWHAPWSIKDMTRQGGLYVLDCVNGDPLAVVAIAAAVAAVGFGLIPEGGPLVVGVLAFLAVLVASGGDALSGRSLVAPFASAVMLLARYPWGQLREAVVLPLGAVLALGMVSPAAPVWSDADFGKNAPSWERWRGEPAPPPTVINHIRDERRLWYQTTGLLKAQRYVPLPDTSRAEATVSQAVTERRHLVDADTIGLLGVVAGSRLHVVDPLARTDAFLARLPASEAWRPGGVTRALPSGYAETIETGENRIADPKLAAYFDTISIVTRGPLFSRARLRALIAANLGR